MAKNVKSKVELPYLIAPDIGFGESKCYTSDGGRHFVIPSLLVKADPSNATNQSEINHDKLLVTTSDGTYWVGEWAAVKPSKVSKRTRNRDRANDPKSRVLFKTMIALGLPDEEGDYEVFISTGLPNEDMRMTRKADLEEFLKNGGESFEVTFELGTKQITKRITVTDITINEQPRGTVISHQYGFDQKKFIDIIAENFKRYVGVIDIGRLTGDCAILDTGDLVASDTINISTVGVSEVADRLKARLPVFFHNKKYPNYKAREEDIDSAILNKEVEYAGETFDVSELVNEIVKEVAEIIADNVTEAWAEEINHLETILLTGGGAELFKEALSEEFTKRSIQQFTIVENAQFANVLGFYILGALYMYEEKGYSLQDVIKEFVFDTFIAVDEVAAGEE